MGRLLVALWLALLMLGLPLAEGKRPKKEAAPCLFCRRVQRPARRKVAALVAVMTGFDRKYQERRAAARDTWFPANTWEMKRILEDTKMEVRFAIGVPPAAYEAQIAEEEKRHGPFLRIPIVDTYSTLALKTVAFWQLVSERYEATYVIKVDDDNYVRLDRLAVAVRQWSNLRAEYIGCFKPRDAGDKRLGVRTHKWYDPHHKVFRGDDSRYAEGPFYVLHGSVVDGVVRSGLLPRVGGPEDLMTGWVMKAFNVSFYDDRRLCFQEGCTDAMISFKWDHAVRDFMDPAKRFNTLCCLAAAHSPSGRDECQPGMDQHAEGLRCMRFIDADHTCSSPTLNEQGRLAMFTYEDVGSDWEWIAEQTRGVDMGALAIGEL